MLEPSIIEYNCYRSFLEDYFDYKKASNRYFSYRSFSMRAGFSSPSFLKMIINNQRNLTDSSMNKVARGFNFSEDIREVFFLLVKENQSKDVEKKDACRKQLLLARDHFISYKERITADNFSDLSFFFEWQNVALYVLVGTEGFTLDYDLIKTKFQDRISSDEIKLRLGLLVKAQMIMTDPDKGYVQTAGIVDLTGRASKENQSQFYSQMIDQSLFAMNNANLENCFFSSSTMHISKEKIPDLKSKIDKFKLDIVKLSNGEYKGNEVFQFNTQVFNLLNIS